MSLFDRDHQVGRVLHFVDDHRLGPIQQQLRVAPRLIAHQLAGDAPA